MPRYFFHVRHAAGADGLAVDPELAGPEAARGHALMVARDLTDRVCLHAVRDWFICSFKVTDEGGRPVMCVPFSDSVTEEDGA